MRVDLRCLFWLSCDHGMAWSVVTVDLSASFAAFVDLLEGQP